MLFSCLPSNGIHISPLQFDGVDPMACSRPGRFGAASSRPPPPIAQEIRSSNCLLFLGAGFSFPARLPGWSQLLVAAANVAAGFVSGQQQAPYLVSRDAHAVSEPVDNNQVKIKVCLGRWGRARQRGNKQRDVHFLAIFCVFLFKFLA